LIFGVQVRFTSTIITLRIVSTMTLDENCATQPNLLTIIT